MSPVLGRSPRAPDSHPVKPGAQARGLGKGTTASRKPTGAPRATGPDEVRRTTRGHQARQRRKPLATTKSYGRVPSNNGHWVPETRAGSTTRNEPRHQNRCQATPNTHTTNPSQEWRGTGRARTQAHTHPNTPARSGGAQPEPKPKHTLQARTPQPGVAGYKRSAHTNTHKPQHPSQEWRGAAQTGAQEHTPQPRVASTSGARTQTRTPQHLSQERQGPAESRAQATRPHRTPQAGVAGYKRSAHTSTHTPQHPSQEWRGAAETRARAHTPTPHTPARSGGVQAERAHKHTNPNTPARSGGVQPKSEPKHTRPHRTAQPGVAGYKQSAHTSTHTARHPSQQWRGAAETPAQAHTPTPHTPARSGGVQAERAHKHAHPNTPPRSGGVQPKPEPKHAHPGQEWRGTSGARTQTRTPKHPSQVRRGPAKTRAQAHTPTAHTPARSGGVQAERAHKQTHTPTPQPGVAGCSGSPSLNTQSRPAHPSQEWRDTSGAQTQAHTHPNLPARSGGAQPKPEPKHTHPHRTPQPGVAGRSRNPRPRTHAHTAHPSQGWRGTSGAHTQTRTIQHPS